MNIAHSHNKAISELADALQCPKLCKKIVIEIESNELVKVTTTHYTDVSNVCSLTETIKKFELVEKS